MEWKAGAESLQKSTPVLNDGESRLLVALNSPTLKNCTSQVIIAVVSKGMVLLGIKDNNAPSKEVMQLIVDECKGFHGSMTLQELNLAFEMAARNQLDFDVSTYQNFSVLYFNQLVSSYKRWASKTRQNIPLNATAPEKEFSFYVYENHSVNYFRGMIQLGYQHFLDGIIAYYGYIPYEWYKVLCDDGFIEYDERIHLKFNARYNDLTAAQRAGLQEMQEQVFKLFQLAKQQNRKGIYERC